jgi:hypothetical protein
MDLGARDFLVIHLLEVATERVVLHECDTPDHRDSYKA